MPKRTFALVKYFFLNSRVKNWEFFYFLLNGACCTITTQCFTTGVGKKHWNVTGFLTYFFQKIFFTKVNFPTFVDIFFIKLNFWNKIYNWTKIGRVFKMTDAAPVKEYNLEKDCELRFEIDSKIQIIVEVNINQAT